MRLLHHTVQIAPGAAPTRWSWMLHGILGNGQNLRAVARRLTADIPDLGFILPDLRNHGDSHALPGPDTLAACAADLDALASAIGITPHSAIGHSFGGKLALVWGAATEARGGRVDQIWALDVPPGRPDAAPALHSEVVHLTRALRGLAVPFSRREGVVEALTALGFSMLLARWMTTNLRRTDLGFVWRFNLDGIEAMLLDYLTVDAWPWLESPGRHASVHVLRAGLSPDWSDLDRFAIPNLSLHRLENSGHWVHLDDPDGLHRLLGRQLASR